MFEENLASMEKMDIPPPCYVTLVVGSVEKVDTNIDAVLAILLK